MARTGLLTQRATLVLNKNEHMYNEGGENEPEAREARARQNKALVAVVIYNVRILSVKEENRYGHAERGLRKGEQLGCNFIGLQEQEAR